MKHLTLEERETIESLLKENNTFTFIGEQIGKHRTTVAQEILNHRLEHKPNTYGRTFVNCKFEDTCDKYHGVGCTKKCSKFQLRECSKLFHPPYVCNSCTKKSSCSFQKYYYRAKQAHNEYLSFLTEARQGIRLTKEEIQVIDEVIAPLIKEQKQSINQVYINHPDLLYFSKTEFYHLIDAGVFSFRNIDLPRKVSYKPRKDGKKRRTREESLIRINRTYKDYLAHLEAHKEEDISIVQMDTVEGNKGGKVLLTLLLVQYNFMLIFIMDSQTTACVNKVFDWIRSTIGMDNFKKIFQVILTDNGHEFFDPLSIELDPITKEQVSHVFYCDPSASYQKGAIEKNHEYIRYILPKGSSFDSLTQEDCNLLMSHINSVPRQSLRNNTPYLEVQHFIDEELLNKLGVFFILPDEVSLSPELLKKKDKQ